MNRVNVLDHVNDPDEVLLGSAQVTAHHVGDLLLVALNMGFIGSNHLVGRGTVELVSAGSVQVKMRPPGMSLRYNDSTLGFPPVALRPDEVDSALVEQGLNRVTNLP